MYQRLDPSFRNISSGPLFLEHGTLKSDTLVFEVCLQKLMLVPGTEPSTYFSELNTLALNYI